MRISEMALRYEPMKTRNVIELEKISVTEEIHEFIGEDFSFYYIQRDNERYRVPISVIAQLKQQLEENKEIKEFKVTKSGEGKNNTRYFVIPFV